MDDKTTKSPLPPYLSWKTLYNYIQSLRQHMPNRIDPSVMLTLSGTNRNLVINAMKFLKLIDENGIPQDDLREWVAVMSDSNKDGERNKLSKVIRASYPNLFETNFNLKGATPSEFSEKIKAMNLSGETARKAETFFLEASKVAGIEISPVIIATRKKGRKAGSVPPGRKPPPPKQHEGIHDELPPGGSGDHQYELPIWYVTFKPLFDKLPSFEAPCWTKADKDAWITAISALMDVYIKIEEKGGK